ncbi:MAG TPA: CHAD domain-containing protein [Verrucomicrobiae bacterium]|nr:CHAD domain-containing protein [Verrucomicrobiae bacterium]
MPVSKTTGESAANAPGPHFNGGGVNGHGMLGPGQNPPALPPRTFRHLDLTLKKQWKRYRKGLRRCQAKFSEGAVHESRVETRRLLSILELLAPFLAAGHLKKARTALKGHLDIFDDLRDTQVQLATVSKMKRSFPAAEEFHCYLEKREERFTHQTRKEVKRIKSRRLGKWVAATREDLGRWQQHHPASDPNLILQRAVARAFIHTKELEERITREDTETIHRTRVAFKRFRYMIEMLAHYLPSANDKLLAAMHRYQTMMGEIQDAEMLLRAWDRFAAKTQTVPGARAFRLDLLRRRRWLIRVYLAASGQLLDFWHVAPAPGKPHCAAAGAPEGTPRPAELCRTAGPPPATSPEGL